MRLSFAGMPMRVVLTGTFLALTLTACGGGTLTLSEYSADMATLVETLDSRLDAEAEKYNSGSPTVEGLRSYLAIRVDAYRTAVDGINATDPPDQVEDLHQTFAKIIGNLLTAEEERAAFAHTVDSVEALPLVWDGPESDAVRAAEADAIVLCRAAQTELDATEQREALADVPWMPSELKEVVSIALDCP